MSAIRHVAPDGQSNARFLTAAFERRVRLWSLVDRSLVAELETVLDFGGQRLALCDASGAPAIVAGAWERHGICAYAPDGNVLWQRKDLRQPQRISPADDGALVVVCFDDRPMHVLSSRSGETVAEVRAVRRFYDSPFGGVALGELLGHVALVDTGEWETGWKTPVEGFAVLSAAASPGAFVFSDVVNYGSDARSSVSCVSLAGDVLWRWLAPHEVNCPAVAWDDRAAEWVGVLNHVNNERPDTLVRWSPDGDVLTELPMGLFAAYAFLRGGHHLVTSDGGVRDSREGDVVWQLPDN